MKALYGLHYSLGKTIMSFKQFNFTAAIDKAITACGYNKPTPIQQQAIPSILAGHDLIAAAQTGTGKTAAFVLPAMQRLSLKETTGKGARILILTPTRELANQVTEAAELYGKFLRFRIVNIVGGMPYPKQLKALSQPVDIIVATPGRLMDHMKNKRLDLSKIEMLILDEADRMLDMGFIAAVEQIAKVTPKNRQTILFSATVDRKLAQLAKHILQNPKHIAIDTKVTAPSEIVQRVHLADSGQHKTDLLNHILTNETIFKAVIFCSTKMATDKLAKQLRLQGYAAGALHGDLRQNQRNKTIQELQQGKLQILVATDVAARGIHITGISHVINYDLPKFAEDYVHRIGRTGRAGESGIAISFVLSNDAITLQRIERYLGIRIPAQVIAGLEPKMKSHGHAEKPRQHRTNKKYSATNKPKGNNKPFARGKKTSDGNKSFSYPEKTITKAKSFSHAKKETGSGKPFSYNEKAAPKSKSFSHAKKSPGSDKSFSYNERVAPKSKSFSHGKKETSSDKSFSYHEKGASKPKSFSRTKSATHSEKPFARTEKSASKTKSFSHTKKAGSSKPFSRDKKTTGVARSDKRKH